MPDERVVDIVQHTNYQGFPVVKSHEDQTIVGFVRKNELRIVLEKTRRVRNLSFNATCTFQCIRAIPEDAHELLERPDILIPNREGRMTANTGTENGEDDGGEISHVDFGQYVDDVSKDFQKGDWGLTTRWQRYP